MSTEFVQNLQMLLGLALVTKLEANSLFLFYNFTRFEATEVTFSHLEQFMKRYPEHGAEKLWNYSFQCFGCRLVCGLNKFNKNKNYKNF